MKGKKEELVNRRNRDVRETNKMRGRKDEVVNEPNRVVSRNVMEVQQIVTEYFVCCGEQKRAPVVFLPFAMTRFRS
jgi:hypothetical protein